MADDTTPAPSTPAATDTNGATADGKRQLGVRINEDELHSEYANAFRSFTTTDEVLLDFGFNLVTLNRQQNSDPKSPAGTLQLDWKQRVVMNYRTAKGLAVELGKIITAYEQQFGEIKQPQQQQPKG